MNDELQGSRLSTLRDLEELTQGELAEALGVTQSFLSLVERNERPLPLHAAQLAAQTFGLPLTFFSVASPTTSAGQFTFRKNADAPVREQRRIQALHGEASRLFAATSQRSGYRSVSLPSASDFDDDAELCASELRSAAGLAPEDPVRNVTRLLERQGVGVVHDLDGRETASLKHSGVSRPHPSNDRPLVATISRLPGAVQRFTLAHEAAHLIFDQHRTTPIGSTRSLEERRAHRFAGALLLPAQVARARITETLKLTAYLRIKADYGISVPAVLMRARDLGLISRDRHRSLAIQSSSMGWRHDEPVHVQPEKPALLAQTLLEAMGNNATAKASEWLGIRPALIRRWAGPDETVETHQPVDNIIQLSSRRRMGTVSV